MSTDTQVAVVTAQPQRQFVAKGSLFSSVEKFELAQRACKMLSTATMLPPAYQNNLGNIVIALDLASQMELSPLTVIQNLNIIHGRPTWSAQFVIAAINASGLFSPLRFEWVGKEGEDSWGCRAKARDLSSGEECRGPLVTIGLAKKEGWFDRKDKNGNAISKWRTMGELMLTYRAATFFGRVYAAHILSGMTLTSEEVEDISDGRGAIVATQTQDGASPLDELAETVRRSRKKKEATATVEETKVFVQEDILGGEAVMIDAASGEAVPVESAEQDTQSSAFM